MTGPAWTPGAVHLTPSYAGGTTDFPDAGNRVVHHTTQSPSGGDYFDRMVAVLRDKGAEPPHIVDPAIDHVGQFFPAPQTGRALENYGSSRINRTGVLCDQIEWVAYSERPFTRYWKPGQNIRNLGHYFDEWGIARSWPFGPQVGVNGPFNRSADIWFHHGGHMSHQNAPGNSHWDAGLISQAELFKGLYGEGGETDKWHPGWQGSVVWPAWFPWPGLDHVTWGKGRVSTANLLIQAALCLHGLSGAFDSGHIGRTWTAEAQSALDNYKAHHGFKAAGMNADIWHALGEMPSNAPNFPNPNLFQVGKKSEASLKMQSLLIVQGFIRPLAGQATTTWRPRAKGATRLFQLSEAALKGDPDGVPGPLTWQKAWTDAT